MRLFENHDPTIGAESHSRIIPLADKNIGVAGLGLGRPGELPPGRQVVFSRRRRHPPRLHCGAETSTASEGQVPRVNAFSFPLILCFSLSCLIVWWGPLGWQDSARPCGRLLIRDVNDVLDSG